MKKLLSFIAVTVTAATAVAAGAYIAKKLEQEKDEEVKLIEIINDDESSKEKEEEPESSKEIHEVKPTEVEVVTLEETKETAEEVLEEVVEEVLVEEFVEENAAEEVVEEITEEVETVTEELVEENTVEEVEIVEELVEEPVEEETTEELIEEVVEEETNPYPLLSERKIAAISNQIQVMIDSMEDLEDVDLQHYIVFPNVDATEEWLAEIEDKGFEIYVEDNGQEVNLIKNSKLDYELLEKEILTLAQVAAEYTGAYKGWAVKVDE